jgi:hypothetical protein
MIWKAEVKFASVKFDSIDPSKTLPAKFERLLSRVPLKKMFKGKIVALKMYLEKLNDFSRAAFILFYSGFINFAKVIFSTVSTVSGKSFIKSSISDFSMDHPRAPRFSFKWAIFLVFDIVTTFF